MIERLTHLRALRSGGQAALDGNVYLGAIRAGMVAVVPVTIAGGLFMIAANLPLPGWNATVAPYLPLLQIPVAATFGVLAIVACAAIAHELGRGLGQDAFASATMAVVVLLMISLDPKSQTFLPDTLGSRGLFTAIVVAVVTVRAQKLFADHDLVIRMPAGVPAIVRESFMSLVPLCALIVGFWLVRFGIGLDINAGVQAMFSPLMVALNTLPGILAYALIVTLLWSVGINGDNAVDVVVAPIFLQYLSANTAAVSHGNAPPFVTAYGFFTTFVNVGGTGATLALALLLCRSRDPGYRQVARLSLPTQIFQINEPIFFGLPIVLNPIFMVPYVLNALFLTAATYALMTWGLIRRPFINVPWTTPPILGHYLVTGGDWRAAVWGAVSIVMAMMVYYPFARAATARRGMQPATVPGALQEDQEFRRSPVG
jgi:PTS system cellobiose-specific IIC component